MARDALHEGRRRGALQFARASPFLLDPRPGDWLTRSESSASNERTASSRRPFKTPKRQCDGLSQFLRRAVDNQDAAFFALAGPRGRGAALLLRPIVDSKEQSSAEPDQSSRQLLIRGNGSAARRWRRTEPSVQSCVFACETSTDAAGRRAPAVHSGSGGVRRNEPDQAGDGEHRAAGGAGGAAAVTATPRPTTTSERGRVARVRVDPSAGMLRGHAEQIPVRRRHR